MIDSFDLLFVFNTIFDLNQAKKASKDKIQSRSELHPCDNVCSQFSINIDNDT